MNTKETNEYIEHEVRIRVLESKHDDIYKEFDKLDHVFDRIDRRFELIDHKFELLDAKIDSRFMLLIVLIITSIILPVVLHALKLV